MQGQPPPPTPAPTAAQRSQAKTKRSALQLGRASHNRKPFMSPNSFPYAAIRERDTNAL